MGALIGAIIAAVISAATTAMSIRSTNRTTEKQAEASNEAAALDLSQLRDQAAQQNEQTSRESLQRKIQAERERGRIRAAQAEASLSGNSSLALLNNALVQESYDVGVLESNRAAGLKQTRANMLATHARNKGRNNVARSKAISSTTGGLMIAANSVEGAASGYELGSKFD